MTVPFAYVATDLFAGSSSPLQKCIKCVEAFEAATQDFFVWQALFGPTFEHTINSYRFDALESRIVEIRVVDHLANLRDWFVCNRKTFRERFERAVIAMMREFGIEHVEGNGVWNSVCTRRKNKFWLPINELRDQPSRSNPVDLRTWSRQPSFTLVLFGVENFQLPRPLRARGATQKHGDVMPTRAVEKIDIANFAKLPSQPLEFGGRLFGVQFLPTRDETLQRFSQRRVILCPRVVEHRDDFLSSESLDFLCTN